MMTLWFDMDGTIADLYAVDGWLDMLIAEDTFPYENAKPMLNMNALAKRLNNLQKQGYQLGIISWCSKNGTNAYNDKVIAAKRKWLTQHLKSVQWDRIEIVPYGTPKHEVCAGGTLFDDEERNRTAWQTSGAGLALEPSFIITTLQYLKGC